jgi:hypothetical protein
LYRSVFKIIVKSILDYYSGYKNELNVKSLKDFETAVKMNPSDTILVEEKNKFFEAHLKKEIPELAWKFVIKKWSTDGTLDTVDPIIVDRVKTELKAIDAKDYEVIYYFARFLVQKSLEKGYIVGSRGLNNQTGPL